MRLAGDFSSQLAVSGLVMVAMLGTRSNPRRVVESAASG